MRLLCIAVLIVTVSAHSALAVTQTVSFQNGANGYTGTVERRIDERGGTNDIDGATVTSYFLDGFDAMAPSPDQQVLLRFGNMIGNGSGQIPAGAVILDAQLQLRTGTGTNADSPGPFGVAALLQPFDQTTTYFGNFTCNGCALGSRGAWWEDGYTSRPLAGFGGLVHGDVDSIDVGALVQRWADGQPNHGLVIQTGHPTGTANGWSVQSTGNPYVEYRPKLSVTYTTDAVEANTFRRDLNGYTGDTMVHLQSGLNIVGTTADPNFAADDVTTDGVTLTQAFLDGPQFTGVDGTANSEDALALIKFAGVFGAGQNQSPSDVPVAKAWLAISGGDASDAAQSTGKWTIHPVLKDWNTTTTYSSFGNQPGLQVHDGDLGPELDTHGNLIDGAGIWFDVTSYLEGVRTGTTDHGLAIRSSGTADGWQIHFNGSDQADLRPKLVVVSGNPAVVAPDLAGDYNQNGVVEAADYVTWRNNLNQSVTLPNDSTPGSVTQADYDVWRANFGKTADNGGPLGSGAAVPEPTASLLVLVAAMCVGGKVRSRR